MPTPTATASPSVTGFVPPDADTASCEVGVAKQLFRLSGCTRKCQQTQANAALQSAPFDDDACEESVPTSCRATFDTASAALPSCPPCLDATAQGGVADQAMQLVESHNGAIYCAGTVPFGGDDSGFVPPDAATAKCEGTVNRALKRLTACLVKCDVKQATALAAGTSFDVSACKTTSPTSCRAVFDGLSANVLLTGTCPACLDAAAQAAAADLVTSFVAGIKSSIYCAGATPLP